MKILIIIMTLFIVSCSHFKDRHERNYSQLTSAQYTDFIKKKTLTQKVYRGFYNVFEAWVTPMTQDTQTAYFNRWADTLMLSQERYDEEKIKFDEKYNSQAILFLDFYAPERKFNKLDLKNTIWKVYMEINGKRLLGKVKKHPLSPPEIKSLFYFHNQFSKAYEVSFDVSASEIQHQPYKIYITSSETSTSFSFN